MARERPSLHGQIIGQALADVAKAGGVDQTSTCATCAFREDCMTNTMAATLSEALGCLASGEPFGCHHGMVDGQPTKACAGMEAARRAPYDVVKSALLTAQVRLGVMPEVDHVRASFDAWATEHDPDDTMNDYQRSRCWKPPT